MEIIRQAMNTMLYLIKNLRRIKSMKKGVVSILVAIVLSTVTVSASSIIDLDSFSDNELESLINQAKAELDSRSGGSDIIYAGIYEAGVDIKEGTYELTTDDDSFFKWVICSSIDEAKQYDKDFRSSISGDSDISPESKGDLFENETTRITLANGEALWIQDCQAYIVAVDKPSYAPEN